MKIGLLGFTFEDPNKGCEALTYTFINMLRRICGENLTIVSLSFEDTLGKVPEYFEDVKFEVKKIVVKDIKLSAIKSFKDCDYIFDITYGDNFSDIYIPKFVLKTTLIKQAVIMSKTPLGLAPQTYGPFKNRWLKLFAAHVIKKSSCVFSRDQLSTQYIRSISGVEAKTVTDLAFALPYQNLGWSKNNKVRVGINVSGLLWRGGFQKAIQFGLTVEYRTYIKALVERLLKDGYEVHLVPHVIATQQNPLDDDVKECCEVHEMYPETILAPVFATPIEAKSYIAQMDVFTGARMHATIAAFSSGVPVILFAYSRKFEGLYGSLKYPFLINGCKSDTDQAINQTIEWIANKQKLKENIDESMVCARELLEQFEKELKQILFDASYIA